MNSHLQYLLGNNYGKIKYKEWCENPGVEEAAKENDVVCLNCGEHVVGNYCPRCGQAASTARFSFKTATRNLLETWGIGSRSFGRSIVHIIMRPGYMINDYIHGKRQPYFPPIKMMLLVLAAFLIVCSLRGNEGTYFAPMSKESVEQAKEGNPDIEISIDENSGRPKEDAEKIKNNLEKCRTALIDVSDFMLKNYSFVMLAMCLVFALTQKLLFRKAPRNSDLSLMEHSYVQVFVTIQTMMFFTLLTLIFGSYSSTYQFFFGVALCTYDLKQFFQYGWFKTFRKVFLMYLLSLIFVTLLIICFVCLIAFLVL